MPSTLRTVIVGLVTCLTATVGVAGAAGAQATIGPRQHFIGLVNGSNADPIVYTVCPGPIWQGRMGPVAGGQTAEVAQVARGNGYTGTFRQVYAWFVPAPNGPTPTQLKFTKYGQPQNVPTSVRVPCGGGGRVEFSSCPYLAPCVYGWVPNYVTVRFEDIAA